MKVFISVDMEGVTGLTDPEDVLPDGADYQRGRVFMTQDANAAVLGAFDAGATEVLVNDSHWIMRNLLLEQLDPRAKVIKGFTKPLCMLQGLDESFDAAVFIGYHSCAGTEGGVLAHTLLGKEIHNVLLDDEPMGETRLNALIAGHFGVPVAFLAGDTACCTEARRVLGENLPTFAVKDGIDMFSATCLHPEVTKAGIRAGVKKALTSAALKKRKPYRVPGEHRFGIEWNTTTIASMCALIPGIRKVTPRLTEFTNPDLPQAMGIILAELLLALQVGQKKIYG
ncbi:MAG TPA: M55 family metallopeptidase [Alphaproteobacteria bacterium]|nr:M55 family metallopeptidase [Alphaproteobacteria bacterium]